MSGLKSDFGTADGLFKKPLQPIPGSFAISTIGSQLAPLRTPTFGGIARPPSISTIGAQFTTRKPPASALAKLIKAWTF